MKYKPIFAAAILPMLCSFAVTNAASAESQGGNPASQQTIIISNALGNTSIPKAGLTETGMTAFYYYDAGDDVRNSCWHDTIPARLFIKFKAGSSCGGSACGCKKPISRIDVVSDNTSPSGSFPIYKSYTVSIDPSKATTSVIIKQGDTPPAFDSQSGLVATPGTMTAEFTPPALY